ncbi:pectinesterase 2-like [Glycine soja]|nr:pectinesterase 2-like [Glycine soja]
MERYLLGHLLNYNDEKGQMLSDDQIADNVIGVLFEAQDITASVLTWIHKYLQDDHKLLEAIKVEKMGVYEANEGGNMPLTWGRTDPNQNTGICIQNSCVMAAEDLVPMLSSFKTFLGRAWREYSRTVFLQTYLDLLVDPTGWLEWKGNFALHTLHYREYKNLGPGGSTIGRVKWGSYHAITSATEASKFTVQNFIAGKSCSMATGIPFLFGLDD